MAEARVRRWADEEMGFRAPPPYAGRPLPTQDQLRQICRGSLGLFLEYLVTHVASVSKVRRVKANLALCQAEDACAAGGPAARKSQRAERAERAALEAEIAQLRARLQEGTQSAAALESASEHLQRALREQDARATQLESERAAAETRVALLEAVARAAVERARVLGEYESRLERQRPPADAPDAQGRLVVMTQGAAEGSGGDKENAREPARLETVALHVTRQGCEAAAAEARRVAEAEAEAATERSDAVQAGFEAAVAVASGAAAAQQSPSTLLQGVTRMSEEAAIALRDATAKLNLHEEARRLKLGFEGGAAGAPGKPAAALRHLVEAMEQQQSAHAALFVECERTRVAAARKRHELEAAIAAMRERDPAAAEAASREATLAGKAAALRVAQEMAEEMRAQTREPREAAARLEAKLEAIRKNDAQATRNDARVEELVRVTTAARKRLLQEHEACRAFVAERIVPLPAQVAAAAQPLRGSVGADAVRLSGTSTDQQAALSALHAAMGLDASVPPSAALARLVGLKRELRRAEAEAAECAGAGAGDASGAEEATKLLDAARAHTQQAEATLLPLLAAVKQEAQEGLAECHKTTALLNEWWEQPGFRTVPWVRCGGLSLEELLLKWRQLCSEARAATHPTNA